MNVMDNFSYKEKMMYTAFIKIPVLYRLFRIYNDKTMLKWEKAEKIRCRAENN